MRVLVMGAGAIGSCVGGFLAQARHQVTLVGRQAHMDAVRRNGLHITGIWGEHRITANLDCRSAPPGPDEAAYDLILVTVKSYDTAQAVEAIVPLLRGDTLVCSYQNGLGNAETIAEHVGWPRTVGARAIFGVRLSSPGHVDVTVVANPTALGVYHPEAPAERVRQTAKMMDESGLPTMYTEDIASVVWAKVAYNCALNPLSALLDVPYGALAGIAHTRAIIHEVVHELYAVGGAMNVALDPGAPDAYLNLLYSALIPPTARHFASMREDFLHKRRTEIDALNGAVCRFGARHGVACPVNKTLTGLVHAREHGYGVD